MTRRILCFPRMLLQCDRALDVLQQGRQLTPYIIYCALYSVWVYTRRVAVTTGLGVQDKIYHDDQNK